MEGDDDYDDDADDDVVTKYRFVTFLVSWKEMEPLRRSKEDMTMISAVLWSTQERTIATTIIICIGPITQTVESRYR